MTAQMTNEQKAIVDGFQAQYDEIMKNSSDPGAQVVQLEDVQTDIDDALKNIESKIKDDVWMRSSWRNMLIGGVVGVAALFFGALGPVPEGFFITGGVISGVLGISVGMVWSLLTPYFVGYDRNAASALRLCAKQQPAIDALNVLKKDAACKIAEALAKPPGILIQTKEFKKFVAGHGEIVQKFALAAGKAAGIIPSAPASAPSAPTA